MPVTTLLKISYSTMAPKPTYNWNCCGLSFGYRRLALGTVENESEAVFSFTLAGVGSAGNLQQAYSAPSRFSN